MNRVTTKRRVILLLLDAFRNRLLVTGREVFGRIFALVAGLGALDDYLFLHVFKLGEGRAQRTEEGRGKAKVPRLKTEWPDYFPR